MRFALPLVALTSALISAVALPGAAMAETVVPVGKFTGVELHGGGLIRIEKAAVQRVTLVQGNPADARFEVNSRGELTVSPCRGFCMGRGRFEVLIETPELESVGIFGGGRITAEGAFPAKGKVSAAIHGGGDIDMRAVPADAAAASIHGGGQIKVSAQRSLAASIAGGGAIRYLGHPAVASSIFGGGSISPLE